MMGLLRLFIWGFVSSIIFACSSGTGNAVSNLQINGTVQSGNLNSSQPLSGYTVNLYAITESSTNLIRQTTSNNSGKFSLQIPNSLITSQLYLTATNESQLELALVIGNYTESSLVINELTTVASAYAMAQFWQGNIISGPQSSILIASGMNQNLVSIASGQLSNVISSPPNADQSNALRLMNTLANAISECIKHNASCTELFNVAKAVNGTIPKNTLQALQNLALNPAQGVNEIVAISNLSQNLYTPSLLRIPDAWTLALKFNNTGSESCPFGGPGNFVFDQNGYLWITNNVVQGTPNSTNCMIVLKPNGAPADGQNDTVQSPVYGGGILGAGYGVSMNSLNQIWLGDFGWGDLIPSGSISLFSSTGLALSGTTGFNNLVYRVQALKSDSNNNLWIASNGNQRIVVYPSGNPDQGRYYSTVKLNPFDISISADNQAWVSFNNESSIAKFKLTDSGIIEQVTSVKVGQSPLGIDLDSYGNIWVSSFKESAIYMVNADGASVKSFAGGGIVATWDVTVDGNDNIYAVNFFPNNNGEYGVAKICGAAVKGCPANASLGTPISPASGYTLPSGGSQVLLSNGDPLYGPNGAPDFHPLMRMTSGHIDLAGNLWVTNNWKPSLLIDATSNPGGDGMVVFVGLAKPLKK
jgi:streptogramin lyase